MAYNKLKEQSPKKIKTKTEAKTEAKGSSPVMAPLDMPDIEEAKNRLSEMKEIRDKLASQHRRDSFLRILHKVFTTMCTPDELRTYAIAYPNDVSPSIFSQRTRSTSAS